LVDLLNGFGLCMFQDGGRFVMIHWNDLYHFQNTLKTTEINRSIYRWAGGMVALIAEDTASKPTMQTIGYEKQLQPVNNSHPVNYDNAYGIFETNISFNSLALLYPNPSFEFSPTEGEPPIGFTDEQGHDINDMGLISSDSYDGQWSWKFGTSSFLPMANPRNSFVQNNPDGFTIDQAGKQIKVSFMWKAPTLTEDIIIDADAGYVPSFGLVFLPASGGAYFLEQANGKTIEYTEAITEGLNPYGDLTQDRWVELSNRFYSEGDSFSIKTQPTTDNIGWQSFSITTPILPNEGIGKLYVRWYCVKIQLFDSNRYPTFIGDQNKEGLYLYAKEGYYLIDNLEITTADAQDPYNRKIGELHNIKSTSNFARAQKKDVDLPLFTYPDNKRVAGNVFYGTTYDDGIVLNNWAFALTNSPFYDRLPATILKQVAKQYQKPGYKFSGDVFYNNLSFYTMFLLNGYDGINFMPLSIEWNDQTGIAKISIVQNNDAVPQNNYIYRGKYEKSARRVIDL